MSTKNNALEEDDWKELETEYEKYSVEVKLPPEMEELAAEVFDKWAALDEVALQQEIASASPALRDYIAGLEMLQRILIFTAEGQGVSHKGLLTSIQNFKKCGKKRKETTRMRNEEIDKALAAGITKDKIYPHMREHFDMLIRGRGKSHMQEEMMWRSYNKSKKHETNCNKAT